MTGTHKAEKRPDGMETKTEWNGDKNGMEWRQKRSGMSDMGGGIVFRIYGVWGGKKRLTIGLSGVVGWDRRNNFRI